MGKVTKATTKPKKEKPFKLDLKNLKGRKLCVMDVSAVMRTYYVKSEPRHALDTKTGRLYLTDNQGNFLVDAQGQYVEYIRPASMKRQRAPLSVNILGETFNTSAIYGLLNMMKQFPYKETDFIFCFDSPISARKSENSDYKAGRSKVTDEYFDQINIVESSFRSAGFTVLKEVGLEGDDMVVQAVQRNYDKYDHVIVVSNDYDLSQTVNYNVYFRSVLNSRADITQDNFEAVVKCPYNTILLYKALVGDKSDNISGVKGFGAVAFKKFLVNEDLAAALPLVRIRNMEYQIIKNATTLKDTQKEEALKSLRMASPRLPQQQYDYRARSYKEIDTMVLEGFLSKYEMNQFLKYLEIETED